MSRDFELIDVCHTIEHGMITYKGLPAPVIGDYLTREESRSDPLKPADTRYMMVV